ncbi:MAG TPA: AAA family ATPase [Thermoanaerobaculia bacterium]|jgi:predicted kinase|nr:AAA family ATPase [Thermoanaerobaculia bacterium]
MEAVILVGIQGSGKSTFYLRRFFQTHVRISLDLLKTRYREQVFLSACLLAKQPFVVDNTNVLAAERARYIPAAKEAGFRVVGYFFEPDVRAAIARNQQRSGRAVVPVKGILGTRKRLQVPQAEEGFDDLYRVEIDAEGEFVVGSW